MRYFYIFCILVVVAVGAILGIRGQKFMKPPLFIFPDMDWQAKYKPQGENDFFYDHSNERPCVPNAISRGSSLHMAEVFSENAVYEPALNPSLFSGKKVDGNFVSDFPVSVTKEMMTLGQQKYAIFCTPCHGASGDGNGITKKYGMIATASYHDDRLREMSIGEIFNTITHGKGQMNAYSDKLSPEERWAVILYVRALQRSQHASLSDVPQKIRDNF